MKVALFLVLSLSAVAMAGPAFTKDNQIGQQQQQQQHSWMGSSTGGDAKGPAIDILKQWCFSSQMSQQELTASFKKLVQTIKSSPIDQATESAVMSERLCQGALVQKSQHTGETYGQAGADPKAHELIKDVYMDALIACNTHECTQQLLKVISSHEVDAIRASYYMTRIAATDKESMKDEQDVKQFAENFVQEQQQLSGKQQQQSEQSEIVERQKLFATTALVGKWLQTRPGDAQIKQVAQKVAQSINERYVKSVTEQEVQQYKQTEQPSEELAKKIAKRNAALKALANIPGHVLKQNPEVEQTLIELAKDKDELITVRQSAIECFEQNERQTELLKSITFDQEEPIEVRVAAYRALMTTTHQPEGRSAQSSSQGQQEQKAQEIVEQIVKHCEEARNQQQDDQFVLYAISHLENIRTSQQPEHEAIKASIAKNKQCFMQIQVLSKKFKQQLNDVRRSSRNYKLEQDFNQLESGLVIEGDLVYESKNYKHPQQQQQQQQQHQILPKLVRVNMSMPIMGETVNVIEFTLRQNQMDEELLSALKLVQNTKFNSESVSKVVDSFKASAEKQQQKTGSSKQVEADLTIKMDGCTIAYLCLDDFKWSTAAAAAASATGAGHQRNTRSVYSSQSAIEQIVDFLRRQPISFNRGFNFNINERIAKLLDVDANILAGLRFESRAQKGAAGKDFEIVAQMEPRFSFEAVVGPAKVSSKKLLQRFATKTALGLRLRFKQDELVDVELQLPMNQMELFTVETQLVEKSRSVPYSYTYLPESIYGQEDIYASYPIYASSAYTQKLAKRSLLPIGAGSKKSTVGKLLEGKPVSHSFETSDKVGRATGLRGKLRLAAAPKELSLLVSAIVEKCEPSMEGIRVRVEKSARQADLKQYQVTISTPGARTERTVAIRIAKQSNSQRTVVKSELVAPRTTYAHSLEIVHDGRQYAIKTELVARQQSRQQWRHAAEWGLISSSQAQSGRLAQFAYKPYVSIESTSLKRPIQVQGQIAYQQSPKSVISYELKCQTTGDFVQGKLIVDARDTNKLAAQSYRKRAQSAAAPLRRSMQSPIELLMGQDITFTHEMIAQLQEHALKVHQMADWSCQKYALKADTSVVYKNLRKPAKESQVVVSAKLSGEQQVFTVERKCPADERKEFVARLLSQVRPAGHVMEVECRYNGRRQSQWAYKHKVEVQKVSQNKYESQLELELVDTERKINEKLVGRARLQNERKQKSIACELSSRQKSGKLVFDFESLAKHQLQLAYQGECFQHKTELRNNQRQFALQSRTDNKQDNNQAVYKMIVELEKPSDEAKMVFEWPGKQVKVAADVKLASGKRSSVAIQTGRFASQGDFSFETIARPFFPTTAGAAAGRFLQNNLRFRSSLKDLVNKSAYYMDSAINAADLNKQASFLRLDSPFYRAELEFDPRQQLAKVAGYARAKRSADQYEALYSNGKEESIFSPLSMNENEKLNLGANKMWMLRSIVSSPFARDQLKQQARRALFEYADRRQQQQHNFHYSPTDERFTMELQREPNTQFGGAAGLFEPMRAKAALSTRLGRPSRLSLESEFMDLDADVTPFGQDESYAKISALSRHPRAAFKKHDSEFRYKKDQGYKAYMKHRDAEDKLHSLAFESDSEPGRYAKMSFDSPKYGKTSYEHQIRKEQQKRAHDQEPVYKSKFALKAEGPAESRFMHETSFDFEEPVRMVEARKQHRHRRSYNIYNSNDDVDAGRYSPLEYLKHTGARIVSSQMGAGRRNPTEQLYKLDFDYQPSLNYARLNVDMPEAELLHSSEIEMKPAEQLYKLQSKLYNRLTKEPSYEFLAATKPQGLATAEQEPIFVHSQHPMFERPISTESLAYTLFKQPLKLAYSDKYGRQASFDYDQSPMSAGKFAGLRQKRAAIFYKDADFEHSTSYDFYPESLMGQMKPSFYKQQQQQQQSAYSPRDVVFKTQTKYGPVVVRADSSDETLAIQLDSPVIKAKLEGETGANMRQLIKFQLDNKSQQVELIKLLRKAPATIRDNKLVRKVARKIDSGRFEHETELLVSIVDQIFKMKSVNEFNQRPVVVIEGEWNQQQGKAFAKINGERISGQAMADLARKTAELVVDVDDKHTMHHVSRMVRTSDKFYSLESMTTWKSRPVFKLIGKVSAMIFEPAHVFARRGSLEQQQPAHVSTFEAVLYEPKEYHITGQFDCDKKEARMIFKSVEDGKISETVARFDDQTETIYADVRLSSQNEGLIYATRAKVSLPGLYQAEQCQYQKYASPAAYRMMGAAPSSCQSEWVYSDKSGNWSAKYAPGEFVSFSSPSGKQTINLAGGYFY